MSTGIIGRGTTLAIADVAGTTFTAVVQPKDIPFPEVDFDQVEISNQDSGRLKEYITGMGEGNEIEVELVYTKAGHAAVNALLGAQRAIKITYPDSSLHEFTGNIKKVGGSSPVNEAIMSTVTIKVTSEPTFTQGA